MDHFEKGNMYRFVPPVGKDLESIKIYNLQANISDFLSIGRRTKKWKFMDAYVEDQIIEIVSTDRTHVGYSIGYSIGDSNFHAYDAARKEVFEKLIYLGVFILLTSSEKLAREFGLM